MTFIIHTSTTSRTIRGMIGPCRFQDFYYQVLWQSQAVSDIQTTSKLWSET